jgi:hypothetical protein
VRIARAGDPAYWDQCMSHQASGYVKALLRDQITRREKLLLMVLADYHSTETRTAYPSIKTLARESLMDLREARRVLDDLEGRILERVPGDGSGHLTAYRFIELDKEMRGYVSPSLRARKEGQKGGQKGGRKEGQKGGQNATAIRKEELEPKQEQEQQQKQHGFAEVSEFLPPEPEHCNTETTKAISAWIKIKTQLQHALPSAEFSQWVRPTYLELVMGDCILLTHPPDGRINEKLRASEELQRLVREAGYSGAKFAPYPDEYELHKLKERFPDAYESLPPALKTRAQRATA